LLKRKDEEIFPWNTPLRKSHDGEAEGKAFKKILQGGS